MYPDIINKTIEDFRKLPGIGEKTAERLALSILEIGEEDIKKFSNDIILLKSKIGRCKICGHISERNNCVICDNKYRNDNLICVVEDYRSVFMFEKTGNYNGKYHVLNGLISPIDGITPDELNIDSLKYRINELIKNENVELIIALKPSIEGETTTLYLKKIFDSSKVKISRLSYGIPMGVDIDYLDSITLDRALQDRKNI